jgi:ANTAR domain/GAF domain
MPEGRPRPAPALAPATDPTAGLESVARSLTELGRDLRDEPYEAALERLVRRGAAELVGARWASVSLLQAGMLRTIARTEPRAEAIDRVQYDLGAGPCVDAVLEDSVYLTGDITKDTGWPSLGERLNAEFEVRSMLAFRLSLLDRSDALAGLNLSSDRPDAFSPDDVHRGMVLATHCALLVTAGLAQRRARELLRTLEDNREIGVAVGVLMARHGLPRAEALDVLRLASQRTNRGIGEIAVEVAETGLPPAHLSPDRQDSAP